MRIAQVAPLDESVPPSTYGGTERVVHYLTEELVAMGHDVTLFASGDSQTSAKLAPMCPQSLRKAGQYLSRHAYLTLMFEQLAANRSKFDVAHVHVDYVHLPLIRRANIPCVTTPHYRQDLPGLAELYREFSEIALVSISNSQRAPLPHANWLDTVYHGLPRRAYRFGTGAGCYLAFLGRMSEEKGVLSAIEIAKQSGLRLKIAAKVDVDNVHYYRDHVMPLLDHPLVEYIGEIDDSQKGEFLGNAAAVLFPITWPEPFGLVQIEAAACGTPVIAFRAGAVPEIIEDGVSGYIVNDIPEAVEAVAKLGAISRVRCRKVFEERFTSRRMAERYLLNYERVLAAQLAPFYRKAVSR